MEPRKKHITKEQKDKMISFLQEHPQMYRGKFTPSYTHAQSKALWSELSNHLNCLPNGASKDWVQWRKTWIDIKKNSKSRLAVRKKYQLGTGGGPPPLNVESYDDKIMELITPICVTGNEDVPDPFTVEEGREVDYTLDHDYSEAIQVDVVLDVVPDKGDIASNSNQSVTQTAINVDSLNTPTSSVKKTRVNKAMRLTESIQNNKRFLQLSEESMKNTNNYQTEKLKILKSYYEDKIKTENRKAKALEDISKSCDKVIEFMYELI